jgi:GDP-D-mannose dehydratase
MFGQIWDAEAPLLEENKLFLDENSTFNPASPYAVTKVNAFNWCKYFSDF